jgi:two-component system, OmpR family, sensor histidine kinase VicK
MENAPMAADIKKPNAGRIEVLDDTEIIIDTYMQILHKANRRWDYFADLRSLSVIPFGFEAIKKAMCEAKAKGTRLRFITEIKQKNISCTKEFIEIVELRHLDGVKGNFGVSDSEYIAISTTHGSLSEKCLTPTIPHAIYSNVIEDIQQQQYVFEILWNKATPAEQRIKEIEEGIEHVETVALKNSSEIARRINKNIVSSNEIKVASHQGGLELIYNHFLGSYRKVLDRHRRGEHKGIRFITTITKDNEGLATLLLNEGVQIRHTKNLTPLSFCISNKEFLATAEKMEGGKMISSMLVSNEPIYIDHYDCLFEQLWDNSIDAVDRINDIKEGVDLADIEVIPRSASSRLRYLELVKNAKEEVLFNFPTSNAFIRQTKIGATPLAIEAAKEQGVKVRILVPYNEEVEVRFKQEIEQGLGRRPIYNPNIEIRYTEQTSGTMATILVVDRKASLVMEIRDDSKTTFDEAIGLSTYSNSKAGVLSYVGIFERLWIQSELYEKLKESEKLKDDFVNIAAHELRTPIQPILGLTQILRSRIKDSQQQQLLDTIFRNAQRLQRLTQDILDVSRIESKSLNLNKELFSLNEMISNVVADYNRVIKEHQGTINLKLEFTGPKEDTFIEADKSRINQVISNLLSNAIKFTKVGTVTTAVVPNNSEIIVSVNDTGSGIDSEVLPKLFTKFATTTTKYKTGTGLGLFISKNIIEAHGGRIWGKNNYPSGKGATFGFSLPFENQDLSIGVTSEIRRDWWY